MTQRILPIVVLLIAIGIFFGYVHPTYTGKVASLRADIHGYDAALVAADAYSKKEAELLQKRNEIPAEGLARLEAFLPDGVDNVQLILDLNSLASRSGLTLADFDIVEHADENNQQGDHVTLVSDDMIDSLDLSVSAVGSYDAFKKFLQGAELSLRPLDVVELNIETADNSLYRYDIKFRIYWLKSP